MRLRWPFALRSTLDDVRHELWLEQQRHAAERERSAGLTQAIIELKTSGAQYLAGAAERIRHRLETREPDAVQRAIDGLEIAKGDPALRRHLVRYADKLRREGTVDEAAIIEAVTSWTDPDYEGAGEEVIEG